jgi:hypothetical protein
MFGVGTLSTLVEIVLKIGPRERRVQRRQYIAAVDTSPALIVGDTGNIVREVKVVSELEALLQVL